ncbi:UNKNOWN [Stylonychia lemnae]|uniref:Uncharacterized protein n=1 Tax=Stylonychia lemnae TaxID=5949 RepID=A0A078A8M7_STYLE|nr:UNKNOWN [Stylonychia lemnae]|eukprot:CDW78236.1 UNKNOWN [Stylonychia lemnae]
MEIMNKTISLALQKDITFVLQFVPSAQNLADAPSRQKIKGHIDDCYQLTSNIISADEVIAYFDVLPKESHHDMNTVVVNYLQHQKKRAYMYKHFQLYILDNKDFFLETETKQVALTTAIAEAIMLYNWTPVSHKVEWQRVLETLSDHKRLLSKALDLAEVQNDRSRLKLMNTWTRSMIPSTIRIET